MSGGRDTPMESGDPQVWRALAAGEPVDLSDQLSDADRTIPADWLTDLADLGSRQVPVAVVLRGVIVQGPVDLHNIVFLNEVAIISCKFTDTLDVSFSRFALPVTFEGTEFYKPPNFRSVNAGSNFDVAHCRFPDSGVASFTDIHVGGNFYAESTIFGEVRFYRARIDGAAFFRPFRMDLGRLPKALPFSANVEAEGPVEFRGDAHFDDATFGSTAEFVAAQFNGHATFSGTRFGGSLLLFPDRVRACFSKPAVFSHCSIEGNAEFTGVRFCDGAYFDRAVVRGSANFCGRKPPRTGLSQRSLYGGAASFSGDVSFVGAEVAGNLEFQGSSFTDPQAKVEFDYVRVGGDVSFYEESTDDEGLVRKSGVQSVFEGKASFRGVHLSGPANFSEVKFRGEALFDGAEIAGPVLFQGCVFGSATSFRGSRLEGPANFRRAEFAGDALFDGSRVSGPAQFEGSTFNRTASFRGARFHSMLFRDSLFGSAPEPQFHGPLDLQGCTYEVIQAALAELTEHQVGRLPRSGLQSNDAEGSSDMRVYDRQVYTTLETTLRKMGYDHEADEVYLARRRRERRSRWSRVIGSNVNERRLGKATTTFYLRDLGRRAGAASALLLDLAQYALFNYGVRPFRLLGISLVVLLIGTVMFGREGAVVPKDPVPSSKAVALKGGQAFGLSLRMFIPVVDLPTGSKWTPSEEPAPLIGPIGLSYSGYATIHRIAGAILVPLGLAAVTGLMRRRAGPSS